MAIKKKTKKKAQRQSAKKKVVRKKKPSKKKITKKKSTKKKAVKKKSTKKKSPRKKATAKKSAKKKSPKKKPLKKAVKKKKASKKKATKKKARRKTVRKKSAKKKVGKKATARKPANAMTAAEKTAAIRAGYNQLNPRTKVVERMVHPEEMRVEFALRREELREQYLQAKALLPKIREWIDGGYFQDVTAYTVGLRKKNGRTISPLRYVIEIHVAYKRCKTTLAPFNFRKGKKYRGKKTCLIPESIDGVLIKVIESRPYRMDSAGILMSATVPPSPLVATGPNDQGNIENGVDLEETVLIGGVPISQENDTENWGTMGIVVGDGEEMLGVANAHFAGASEGMVQPPAEPDDTAHWQMGTVAQSFMSKVGDYHVDAAAIEIEGVREVVSHLIFGMGDSTEPFLFADVPLENFGDTRDDEGQPVFRLDFRLNQNIEGAIDNAEFTELKIGGVFVGTVIRARRNGSGTFIRIGESGSVLYTRIQEGSGTKNLVVGLCFAGLEGEQEILFACNFSHVKQALNLPIPANLLRTDWIYP